MNRYVYAFAFCAFAAMIIMAMDYTGTPVSAVRSSSFSAPVVAGEPLLPGEMREEGGVAVSPTASRTMITFDFPPEMSSPLKNIFEVFLVLRPTFSERLPEGVNPIWVAYPVFNEREMSLPISEEAASLSETGFYAPEDGTVFFELHVMFQYAQEHHLTLAGIAFAPTGPGTPALTCDITPAPVSPPGEHGTPATTSAVDMKVVLFEK
jgi:hypothetical protein